MNHLLEIKDKQLIYFCAALLILGQVIIIAGILAFPYYFKLAPLLIVISLIPLIIIIKPEILLFLFILILPFQYLMMMVLFGVGGVPSRGITIISAWKEIFVSLVFISFLVQLLLGKKVRFRLSFVDGMMLIFIGYALVHFFLPDEFLGVESNIHLKLYGFKSEFFFIFLYFAGRLCHYSRKQVRQLFVFLVGIGVITALFGIVEVSFLKEETFLKLGYVEYTENHMGIKYKGPYGLAENFWTDIGGVPVRRAVSVYMSSQPFAQSYLLIIPFSIILLFRQEFKKKYLLSLGLLIMFVALIMTITRVVIAVCFGQILLLGLMKRKFKLTKIFVAYALLILFFILLTPNFMSFFKRTVSFEGPSEKGHLDAWARSLEFVKKYPFFGVGIGMGGETSRRFKGLQAGLESELLVYAAEVGIIGLVIYLTIFVGILKIGFKMVDKAQDDWLKDLLIPILVCGIGIFIVSSVSHTRGAIFVYYVYWWLAGYLVKVCSEINPRRNATI